jgi:hypothetical protein
MSIGRHTCLCTRFPPCAHFVFNLFVENCLTIISASHTNDANEPLATVWQRGFGPRANYADRATAVSWLNCADFCK